MYKHSGFFPVGCESVGVCEQVVGLCVLYLSVQPICGVRFLYVELTNPGKSASSFPVQIFTFKVYLVRFQNIPPRMTHIPLKYKAVQRQENGYDRLALLINRRIVGVGIFMFNSHWLTQCFHSLKENLIPGFMSSFVILTTILHAKGTFNIRRHWVMSLKDKVRTLQKSCLWNLSRNLLKYLIYLPILYSIYSLLGRICDLMGANQSIRKLQGRRCAWNDLLIALIYV